MWAYIACSYLALILEPEKGKREEDRGVIAPNNALLNSTIVVVASKDTIDDTQKITTAQVAGGNIFWFVAVDKLV